MITPDQHARLLETLAGHRRGKETADARIAAIVLLALDGVRPRDALRWRVIDLVAPAPTAGQWTIKHSAPVRSGPMLLTLRSRAALTVYLAQSVADGSITKIDRSLFWRITWRAVQAAWTRTRGRAKLAGVTFHDLRPSSTPAPERAATPRRLSHAPPPTG